MGTVERAAPPLAHKEFRAKRDPGPGRVFARSTKFETDDRDPAQKHVANGGAGMLTAHVVAQMNSSLRAFNDSIRLIDQLSKVGFLDRCCRR